MHVDNTLSVVIIGGGASGVLLATHLLRQPIRPVHLTLIEKRPHVGRGVAYSAVQHDHTLNVPASAMSAVPDPERICLDVTPDLAVIDAGGSPAQRLFAVGPLTRGQFSKSKPSRTFAAKPQISRHD